MLPGGSDRARRRLLRAAACLLVAVIGADLADTACDPVTFGAASATELRATGSSGVTEPCGDVCVADCFCCSRSVPAGTTLVLPRPEQLTSFDIATSEHATDGVPAVVDRPPLA